MTADHTPARNHIRFGRFALDLVERQLTCSDQPVKLSSRALDILCELASANGAVVDKNRIMDKVWPGRVVEENAIQVHVSSLRKALEAGSDGHSYVMTIPGRGYRLVGLEAVAAAQVPALTNAMSARGTSVGVLRFANLSGDPGQDYLGTKSWKTSLQGCRASAVFPLSAPTRAYCSAPGLTILPVSVGN